jgi:hypothetical protein
MGCANMNDSTTIITPRYARRYKHRPLSLEIIPEEESCLS